MKLWHEVPSANFKVKPTKDMLIGSGISKLFSSIPTRSTIPMELRPRELYQYEFTYVIAYLNDVFNKLGATLDYDSLSIVLKHLAQADRTVKLQVSVASTASNDYVDDWSNEYLVSSLIVEFLASTDSPESPRNKKATDLAMKIKNLLTSEVYEQAYKDIMNKKASRL